MGKVSGYKEEGEGGNSSKGQKKIIRRGLLMTGWCAVVRVSFVR
jgi:hypothetical protein